MNVLKMMSSKNGVACSLHFAQLQYRAKRDQKAHNKSTEYKWTWIAYCRKWRKKTKLVVCLVPVKSQYERPCNRRRSILGFANFDGLIDTWTNGRLSKQTSPGQQFEPSVS